jgi:ribosome-binding protein aMBF1 (putative translation factor)
MTFSTVEDEYAAWIREQRERANLTQRELADALGCSLRAIQTYEAGDAFPRPRRRRKIEAYFNGQVEAA